MPVPGRPSVYTAHPWETLSCLQGLAELQICLYNHPGYNNCHLLSASFLCHSRQLTTIFSLNSFPQENYVAEDGMRGRGLKGRRASRPGFNYYKGPQCCQMMLPLNVYTYLRC